MAYVAHNAIAGPSSSRSFGGLGQMGNDPLARSYERLHGITPQLEPSPELNELSYGEYDAEVTDEGEEGQGQGRSFLVRAKFDYIATDPSALSFRKGDLIEVITTLDSGWWDGMLGDARGWFPSNYVDLVEQDELDEMEREGYGLDEEEEEDGGNRGAEVRRTILAEEALGIDDALGAPWGGGSDDLDALARSMGVSAGAGEGEGGEADEFMIAARRQRARADTIDTLSTSSPVNRFGPSGSRHVDRRRDDAEDFGAGLLRGAEAKRREREGTAGTIRGNGGRAEDGTTPVPGRRGAEETPRAGVRKSTRSSLRNGNGEGGEDDAWIPCLTADGEVYYHNTQTGEDSWDLPVPNHEEDDLYEDEETDYFPTPGSNPPSSTYIAEPSISDTHTDDFRPPPKATSEIPYPWVSRLSDDGQQWYYINRLTGAESLVLPREEMVRRESNAIGDVSDDLGGMRLGSVPLPAGRSLADKEAAARKRLSPEQRAKAMLDWERRSRHKLEIATRPTERSSLSIMLEIINDTLREVFEASVTGSAAEEEMSRAIDLNSHPARLAAIAREEQAVEQITTSHRDLLASIGDLLRAFGYVGPIDTVEDMPRPAWTGDITLVGSVGVFSANVHAALYSKKIPETKLSVWQEVMRSASKLRDILVEFPELATGGAVTGRRLWAWIGVENPVGGVYAGRWGFGGNEVGRLSRVLGDDVLADAEHARGAFESSVRDGSGSGGGEERELGIMRTAERVKAVLQDVDVAAVIDIDGIPGDEGENDLSRKYGSLVHQARAGVSDLDRAVLDLDRYIAAYYLALCHSHTTPSPQVNTALSSLSAAVTSSTRSLSTILAIARDQRYITDTLGARGQIGVRSPRYGIVTQAPAPPRPPRPASIVSDTSRGSRASRASAVEEKRGKTRGIEDDFQDSEERLDRQVQAERERDRDRDPRSAAQRRAGGRRDSGSGGYTASSPISNSGSQVSLARVAAGGGNKSKSRLPEQPSAGSSTTSLAYQRTESDAGSTRGGSGQRASTLMKGFFGRSNKVDSEAESREKAEKVAMALNNKQRGARKLAKLLGEDVSNIPHLTTSPPPIPPPLQPNLQRQQSLSQQSPSALTTPGSAGFGSISLPAPPPPPPAAPAAPTPWYLAEDYKMEDIVFDDKGAVKAGTLQALVARLTPHGATDTSFFQAFMLTFRSFTTGDLLFEQLLERYHVPQPAGMDEMQEADWVKLKQTPIRLRVANVLRAWLDVHFMVDQDMPMLDKIEHFATSTMVDAVGSEMLRMLSKTLNNLVARRRRGEDPNQRRIVSGGLLSPPAPLLPRVSGKTLQLTDIPPLELARQLTIIEFANFQRIRAPECLHKLWASEDELQAVNVRIVIHTANKLAAWIGYLVLQPKDAKGRAALMKYFIQCAFDLRLMNNFSSMAAIIAGLNAAPVDRLKRTKELLSAKTLAMKEDLDKTMDSSKNFANYKEMLKTINPPCVPFLGFYLSALTFIEDGNRDLIDPAVARAIADSANKQAAKAAAVTRGMVTSPSVNSLASAASHSGFSTNRSPVQTMTGTTASTSTFALTASTSSTTLDTDPPKRKFINFFKRHLSAEIIRDIQQYQSQPYNLAKCKPVQDFLAAGLQKVEAAGDMYDRSLLLEPREREEERIQRMLHDSGFI